MKKNRTGYKFLFMVIMTGLLMVCHTKNWQVQAEENAGSAIKITSEADGNFANVVVYVDFKDTDHTHPSLRYGSCFKTDPLIEKLFDGEAYPRSLTQYLKKVSYNQLIVSNIFPQYNASTGTITPYELLGNAQDYASTTGRSQLVTEVIQQLQSANLSGVNLDKNNDGCIDNLMIVVPCETDVSNSLFYGLTTQYAGNEMVNSSLVRYYNIVTESGAYMGQSGSGLLIHEFMHTLGYPDLYNNDGGTPVGTWDIMSLENHRVQYPLAYYRYKVSNWIDIPTVTTDQTQYSLVAASASTDENKNNQAVILKTGHSETEFFVIEYRKKGDTYGRSDDGTVYYDETSLDASIYDSGLIIYRINTNKTNNRESGAWAAYVFRPGDSYGSEGIELASNDKMSESCLSSESGRTSYGSEVTTATLSDGAITYSDGTNSGIVISNVGSASGDTITFDITFTEQATGVSADWTLLNDGRDGETTCFVSSYMDSDGTIYCVETDYNNRYSQKIYCFDGTTWTYVCDAPAAAETMDCQLTVYNQTLYCAYMDKTNAYLHLAKWSGSAWSEVYRSSIVGNEFSLASDSYGLTLAFVNFETFSTNSVYAYILTGSGGNEYTVRASGTSESNIRVTMVNGAPYLVSREVSNNNQITVWGFASGEWKNLGSPCAGNAFDLTSDGQTLYLFASNDTAGGYLYTYDLSADSPGWQQCDGSFSDVKTNTVKAIIYAGVPYVFYEESDSPYTTRVKGYVDSTWTEIGLGVSNYGMNGMALYGKDENLYAVYCRSADQKTYIKTHAAMAGQPAVTATTAITVDLPEGYDPNLYIDGILYETTYDSTTGKYVVDPGNTDAKVVTAYKLNTSGGYPVGMYVWILSYQDTAYAVTPLPEFENILAYNGFSARITGDTGLRYKSSIATSLKQNLLKEGGVDGYELKEYGVIAIPKAYISTYPLVYNGTNVRGTVDFKVNEDGTTSEILYVSENGNDYFTGLLVGIPKSQYKTDVAFRSYIILEKDGTEYIIYQLPQTRSLYYVSKQYLDKNMYASGTEEYEYLQQIIADAE
jgi:M6 family metalloprotease-like protein